MLHRFLPLATALMLWPDTLFAQQDDILKSGRRILSAERMRDSERITLDGILDEPQWQRAISAGDFIMQDPILGATPTEPTDIRIVFNKDHLYIGVTCRDSEPDKLLGNTRKRDEFLSADDRFMWTMDTFLNEQTGYFFEMNPSGLMADALMGPGGTNSREWDGIWNARVRRSEIGWTIEIDIPFRTLAFDPNAPAWGVNFQRTVRRKNEETVWTGHLRNQGLRRMSNAGLLVGLKDVTQGHGVEIKPYVAATVSDAPGRVPVLVRDQDGDVGGEVTYNLTPSLRAVGTVNTDFAETEVDTRLVNLTRFPLFFPEKRGFFLDGATFFDFQTQAFFSRRIGLDENGQPQRIDAGGKLTGQAGPYDAGVLYTRTGNEDHTILGEDALVARVRRRVLRQSYVGGIYTARAARDQSVVPTRSTLGADFRLATSTFRGNQNLEGSGYLVWNSTPGSVGESAAFGGRIGYPNDVYDGSFSFGEVQKNHDPALGFTPRRNFRRYNPTFRYSPRPRAHPNIRRFGFGADLDLYTDTKNRLVTRELDFTVARVELHSGDNLEASVVPTYERLEEHFEIATGITLPAGSDYSFTRFRVSGSTANKRVFSFQPRIEWGHFLSGTRTQASLTMGIRPRPGVTLNLSTEWNDVNLQEGEFETRLFRMVADTQFSPFMYLVNNIQYDSVSRVLGWQSRFRWILTPGNDLFVVYTQNWLDPLDPASRFLTLDRRGATKAVYTKRF
jgi:Domain of unknown function (DUF5916)